MAAGRSMKNVLVVSSGFLLLFSATGSLVSLQSSLNAEEGVGVASASTLFASVILSSMFLAPLVIRLLGCKWTIVAAMSCHVTYTAGNFCPGCRVSPVLPSYVQQVEIHSQRLPGNSKTLTEAPPICSRPRVKQQERQAKMAGRSMKNVLVVSSGFLLLFSATGSLVSLQSSLNAEEGVGVASASTLFASVILSSMFLAPLVIRLLGCKWTIVAAMSCHVTYTAGNFCPGWATLIPTSVVLGLGEAPLWSATSTYLILTGQAQARRAKARSQDLINQYFGIWFLFYQSAAIWGSLTSSLVLGQDAASVNVTEEDLQFCGAGSCLDQEEFINSTRPAERLVHTLMGCYLGAGVLAMLLVAAFLDDIGREGRPEAGRGSSGTEGLEVRRTSEEEVGRSREEEVRRSSEEEVRRSSEEEEVRRSSEEEVRRSSEEEEPFCSTFLATFRQLSDRRQVLLIPLTSYIGLELGFLSGEYNRDYVTCALGIRFVGYAVICFGSSSALCCFLFGRLSRYTGRVTLFSLAAVTHLSCILALLFWRPHPDQLPVFFVFPALWGLADAVWQTQTNALYGVLFHRQKEAAFANYRLWESAGYVVAFACSHFLCVSTKLYVLLSALLLSVSLCFAVEYGEFRNPTPENSAGATATQGEKATEELSDRAEEAGLK